MSTAEQDYSGGVSTTQLMAFSQVTGNTPLNSDSWTFPSQVDTVVGNVVGIANCVPVYDWWNYTYHPYMYSLFAPIPTCIHTHEDKGKRAFEIVKNLQTIKVIKLTTAKQFADTMDAVLKVL